LLVTDLIDAKSLTLVGSASRGVPFGVLILILGGRPVRVRVEAIDAAARNLVQNESVELTAVQIERLPELFGARLILACRTCREQEIALGFESFFIANHILLEQRYCLLVMG